MCVCLENLVEDLAPQDALQCAHASEGCFDAEESGDLEMDCPAGLAIEGIVDGGLDTSYLDKESADTCGEPLDSSRFEDGDLKYLEKEFPTSTGDGWGTGFVEKSLAPEFVVDGGLDPSYLDKGSVDTCGEPLVSSLAKAAPCKRGCEDQGVVTRRPSRCSWADEVDEPDFGEFLASLGPTTRAGRAQTSKGRRSREGGGSPAREEERSVFFEASAQYDFAAMTAAIGEAILNFVRDKTGDASNFTGAWPGLNDLLNAEAHPAHVGLVHAVSRALASDPMGQKRDCERIDFDLGKIVKRIQEELDKLVTADIDGKLKALSTEGEARFDTFKINVEELEIAAESQQQQQQLPMSTTVLSDKLALVDQMQQPQQEQLQQQQLQQLVMHQKLYSDQQNYTIYLKAQLMTLSDAVLSLGTAASAARAAAADDPWREHGAVQALHRTASGIVDLAGRAAAEVHQRAECAELEAERLHRQAHVGFRDGMGQLEQGARDFQEAHAALAGQALDRVARHLHDVQQAHAALASQALDHVARHLHDVPPARASLHGAMAAPQHVAVAAQ
ncbi:unnamed protein product, partial [Prorocentrum cordatum]